MRKFRFIFIGILLFLLTSGTVLAMSSSSYQLPWQSLSASGGDRESANYTLRDTVGQPSPIGISESTNYRLRSGYWYGASKLLQGPPQVLPGDANGDGDINVLDMTKVARMILQLEAENTEADANQDGGINVLDMTKIAKIILGLD